MAPGVSVTNWRAVSAAFAKADRDSKLALRAQLRDTAQPVRMQAEGLAHDKIRSIGERWSKMRIGITRTVVYVAPRQRGVRGKGSTRARPNLAPLLMARAMEPALEGNRARIEHDMERVLEAIADDFNHGGL